MITYNELYEALRKEKYSDQLQLLPKSFIKNCSKHTTINRKLTMYRSRKDSKVFKHDH